MAASIVLYSYQWNLKKLQYLLINKTSETEIFNIASDHGKLSDQTKKFGCAGPHHA